ncbi:patatin-like phospholipase family protein, partial [bacterium]|nr:patatin-like phospholipase family protein [bacterium]
NHLPSRFSDLEFPLVCCATDIDTGELIYLRDGDLPSAIRATCAFPGAFVPVERDGRNLVDGGLKSTVPVQVIREYDVDRVVACDFQPPLDRPVVPADSSNWRNWSRFWETLTFRRRNLAADILLKAVDILQTEVCRRQLADHPPDILIAPPMRRINLEDFRLTPQIIAAGAEEARRVLGSLVPPQADGPGAGA